MSNVSIAQPKRLEEKLQRIREGGAQKLHVIADFDRTLTRAFFSDGSSTPTSFSLIRNGNYLREDYTPQAQALFKEYHPVELDTSLPLEFRNGKMKEWWIKHLELIARYDLSRTILESIMQDNGIEFRGGALDFLQFTHDNSLPMVIMSAGLGDLITGRLKNVGHLHPNIHVVSNFFEFNDQGFTTGVGDIIIHSLNKHEVELSGLPFYPEIQARPNAILLGDSEGDLGMVAGMQLENLVTVGFLNEEIEKRKAFFDENFDVVISNDGDMEYVNQMVRSLL